MHTLTGITKSTYTNYEAGNREPKYEKLCQIAAALHITTDELLGYTLDEFDKCQRLAESAGYSITTVDDMVYVSDNDDALSWNSVITYTLGHYQAERKRTTSKDVTGEPLPLPMTKEDFIKAVGRAHANFEQKNKQHLYDEFLFSFMGQDFFSSMDHDLDKPDKPDKAQ
jgi:transcriptional regulator with XRE-family HTH domain